MKLKHFNIMRILYCMVLALPFVAILSRVIYVQSNKNAYESYEGQVFGKDYINTNNVPLNNVYFTFNNETSYVNPNRKELTFENVEYISGNLTTSYIDTIGSSFIIQIWEDTNYNRNYCTWTGLGTNLGATNYQFTIKGDLIATNSYVIDQNLNNNLIYTDNNIGSTLDNVFEYSVNKFIDDNNFGRVNLFEWTTDLFFDNNEVNNLYVHFVNWYLNYVLLMSTTYILFLVLMWFVNYSRRLLERGMNYDW